MAKIVQDFGEQRVMRGPENRIIYVQVYRLDCGCSMEVGSRDLSNFRQDIMRMIAEATEAHQCGIVFTAKVYDPVRPERPVTRPTYMGVPISLSGTMREFYSEVRAPARPQANPLGFKPEQLDALKTKITEPAKLHGLAVSMIIEDELADYPEPKKPEPKDRFDLIEID